MKKTLIVVGAIIFVCFVLVLIAGVFKFNFTNDDIYTQSGEKIGSEAGLPGIRYFGNEAKGDFNGDGTEDVAFLFTEDNGGSGTFYYVTVRLASGKELNSILLGDRIAPQTTEFRDGKIIVNYADRKLEEPMTAKPSIGLSRYLKVVGDVLVEIK